MRTLFIHLCVGAALALPLAATAAAPAGDDQVAASFARMLNHAAVAAAPAAPTAREDDPLHTRIAAVLWERHPGRCGPTRADVAAVALRTTH